MVTFSLYGEEPEFKKALLQFGDVVIPVVDYFLQNEITTITAQEAIADIWQKIKDAVK